MYELYIHSIIELSMIFFTLVTYNVQSTNLKLQIKNNFELNFS